MPFSIWRLPVSPPSSLSSISLQHPPSHYLPSEPSSPLSPPLATRLSLPSSFPSIWYFVFTSQPHFSPSGLGFFFPLRCFAVWHLFTPNLSSAASPRSFTLTSFPPLCSSDLLFFFSPFHLLSSSLSLFTPPPPTA